jgi:ubiquinone/menaquinone biosynthesis C-methylase UbiE
MINEIASYWDKQSAIWREEKREAWAKPETQYWIEFFEELLPTLKGNKVLEVGTASGYFAHILTRAGYAVTAVDVSPNMVKEAELVTQALGMKVDYYVMDAQELDFDKDQFDLVFTRLMTWTIPDVKKCYGEVFRVLRPGGLLLNFDGDFGDYVFTQEGHEQYPAEIMEQANIIKSQLDISKHKRPEKDMELLHQVGFTEVLADHAAPARILHLPVAGSDMFKLQAIKPDA